jgi:hypothetical protein
MFLNVCFKFARELGGQGPVEPPVRKYEKLAPVKVGINY